MEDGEQHWILLKRIYTDSGSKYFPGMYMRSPLLMLAMVVSMLTCHGIEYFVAVDGDDGNDGRSAASAFASVQRGVDALEAGDILTILPGDYLGNVRREGLGSAEVETRIRAAIPGTVTLRGDVPAPGFRPVEGTRFVYVKDFDAVEVVPAVNEVDTLTILQSAPNARELEFSPGMFYYDAEAGKLYIAPSDMGTADSHYYTVSVVPTHGVYLANAVRVVVEGLGVTGFNAIRELHYSEYTLGGVWGIFLANAKSCVIRDCRAWLNGWGIGLNSEKSSSGDNVIERCAAWGNFSRFQSGDMGGLTGFRVRRDTIRDSMAFLNGEYGINIYGTGTDGGAYGEADVPGNDEENKSRLVNNLAWGNFCDFKIKTGVNYHHTVESSIGPGLWSVQPNVVSHSIIGRGSREFEADSINLSQIPDLDPGAEFADPLNFDYRLQATSQFRGTGPGGSDRGPFPYKANIFFVSPGGDDSADGLSVGNAWQTLERALVGRKPGDTVYLLEGEYELPARLDLPGRGGEPVYVRGRGQDRVVLIGAANGELPSGLVFERVELAGTVPPLTFGTAGLPIGFHPSQARQRELLLKYGPEVFSVSATTANIEWMTSLPATCRIAWGTTPECENELNYDAGNFGSFSLSGLEPGTKYYFRIRSLSVPTAKAERISSRPAELVDAVISFTTAEQDRPAATFYVAPDGDDRNSGLSREEAWRSIQHAADRAAPGDTVLIAGGVYQERVRIRTTGEEDRLITFRCIPGEKVIFDGKDKVLTGAFVAMGKSHLRFDGLHFRDFNFFPGGVSTYLPEIASELVFYKGKDVRITRCLSDGRRGYTARFITAKEVPSLVIENCVITNKMSGSLLLRNCPDVRMEHCVIARPLIQSYHLWNQANQPGIVRHNIFTDCIEAKASNNVPFAEFSANIENVNNCYFMRRPSDVRFVVSGKTIHEIDPSMVRDFILADPGFAGDPGVRGKPDDKSGFSPDRLINLQGDLEFYMFFATNPELVERGIGLQPEVFADFHFNRTEAQGN